MHTTLLQAIATSLSALPPSSFPLPSSAFYTNHLLPSRPSSTLSQTPLDIKHSTHKSLTAFLKTAEKANLLSLKTIKNELFVATVSQNHPEVAGHKVYSSLRDAEAERERQEELEKEVQQQLL